MIKYWRQAIGIFKHAFGDESPQWIERTVDDLFNQLNSDLPTLLVDVRPVAEYNNGHIPNALSIPMLELESKSDELEEYKDKEIITICPGGGLSLVAIDILTDVGFKDVKSLKGGTDEWRKNGYPLTTSVG